MIGDLWFKNAIVYSLDVETFLDGNGDGCGDFVGLARRLDYLESLGVDALWLAPFQPSPNRDNGYDVSDYYGVDPRHGTLGDFVELVHEAGSRGIRVLVDLVVNHTSDRHPWFEEARASRDASKRDWYVWAKKRPADWRSGVVFPGVQKTTWTYDRGSREWYFHRFYDFQPDLNMDNPRVREEIRRVLGFWLQAGVAGFRVDAVPFVLEGDPRVRKPPTHFEYLREFRELLQWRVGDAILLGEANVLPADAARYFADGDGLHMIFNFWVNQHLFYGLASGDARPLAEALRATARIPALAQWAHFLRNHDELDLGRLEPEQRELVFDRFAPQQRMRLYDRGIRRRLAPMLGGDRQRLELAYSLLFSLPGTPVLQYGEELGMGDDLRLKERGAVRTPMQWSSGPNGGFSTAEQPVRPVVARGVYGYESVNVERARRDPESLLLWLTRLIRLRKECPEVGWGAWRIVPTRLPSVLAVLYEWRGNRLLCLHNLAPEACAVTVAVDGDRLASMLDAEELAPVRGRFRVELGAHGYRWYRVGTPTRR